MKHIIDEHINYIKQRYIKEIHYLNVYYRVFNNTVLISSIIIKEEFRCNGIGNKIMQEIINICNEYNIIITLNPLTSSTEYDRLLNFYYKLGFIENDDYEIKEKLIKKNLNI